MSVKREDLLAAAALGVLQYKQVDPILIFLLQRDMRLARESRHVKKAEPPRRRLYYLAALLAVGAAALLIASYMNVSLNALDAGKLLWFSGLYVLFTVVMIAWFEWQHVGIAIRIFATSGIALVPLAIFASHQIHLM